MEGSKQLKLCTSWSLRIIFVQIVDTSLGLRQYNRPHPLLQVLLSQISMLRETIKHVQDRCNRMLYLNRRRIFNGSSKRLHSSAWNYCKWRGQNKPADFIMVIIRRSTICFFRWNMNSPLVVYWARRNRFLGFVARLDIYHTYTVVDGSSCIGIAAVHSLLWFLPAGLLHNGDKFFQGR